MATVILSKCNRVFSLQTMTVDSAATTMFNSAAYFTEDPAADRLFAVTNPWPLYIYYVYCIIAIPEEKFLGEVLAKGRLVHVAVDEPLVSCIFYITIY